MNRGERKEHPTDLAEVNFRRQFPLQSQYEVDLKGQKYDGPNDGHSGDDHRQKGQNLHLSAGITAAWLQQKLLCPHGCWRGEVRLRRTTVVRGDNFTWADSMGPTRGYQVALRRFLLSPSA